MLQYEFKEHNYSITILQHSIPQWYDQCGRRNQWFSHDLHALAVLILLLKYGIDTRWTFGFTIDDTVQVVSPYTLAIIVRLVGPSFVVSLAVELMSWEDSYALVVRNVVLGQSESTNHASESNIFLLMGLLR